MVAGSDSAGLTEPSPCAPQHHDGLDQLQCQHRGSKHIHVGSATFLCLPESSGASHEFSPYCHIVIVQKGLTFPEKKPGLGSP